MCAFAPAPADPAQQQRSFKELLSTHAELKREFDATSVNTKKTAVLLARAKLLLATLQFLIPPPGLSSAKSLDSETQSRLTLARDVLEFGCLHGIYARDIPVFERYWVQLVAYYTDFAALMPDSPRRLLLHGLHLLALLAQGRIAEFHVALGRIPPRDLSCPHVRHAVQLEEALMEGSYNRIWRTRSSVPSPECTYFVDILMETIRGEIAACAKNAYADLPLTDSTASFFFIGPSDLAAFCKKQGWVIDHTARKIVFSEADLARRSGDSNSNSNSSSCGGSARIDQSGSLDIASMSQNALIYANELERIV